MRNFDFSDMGPDNQVLFFKRAYKLRSDFWLDRLDCSVSFHRQKVEGGDALSKRLHGLELPLMTIYYTHWSKLLVPPSPEEYKKEVSEIAASWTEEVRKYGR